MFCTRILIINSFNAFPVYLTLLACKNDLYKSLLHFDLAILPYGYLLYSISFLFAKCETPVDLRGHILLQWVKLSCNDV